MTWSTTEAAFFMEQGAKWMLHQRNRLQTYFGGGRFNDPMLDFMLELCVENVSEDYYNMIERCKSMKIPVATGLRRIQRLVDLGLLVRIKDNKDGRVRRVEMTAYAVRGMTHGLGYALAFPSEMVRAYGGSMVPELVPFSETPLGDTITDDQFTHTAIWLLQGRRMLNDMFGAQIAIDPQLDIILFVASNHYYGSRAAMKGAAEASGLPISSGYRLVREMIADGLLVDHPDQHDLRLSRVLLSDFSLSAAKMAFEQLIERPDFNVNDHYPYA